MLRYVFQLILKMPPTRSALRFLLGMLAIPTFRILMRKVVRVQDLDEELEKDLEQWFRASLVLLAATANMEHLLFGFVTDKLDWLVVGGRILLAVGVIETMPDQELFSIIHPGPPRLKFRRGQIISTLKENWRPIVKGVICQHVNRSSPVFAILSTIYGGIAGWTFYLIAIIQYLIIGLVTSRDRALDVLSEFDKQVTIRRRELMDEFDISDQEAESADASRKAAEETQGEEVPAKQPAGE